MPDSTPTALPAASKDPLFAYPLTDFYTHAGLPLPRIEPIEGSAVPEPYRSLLIQDQDLSPVLEAFHKSKIHLEILKRDERGSFYFREVVLRLDHDETAVTFCANKIFVGRFPEEARELILAEQVPLGRVLADCHVKHRTEARAFLRIEADAVIMQALDLENPATVYGRKTVITDPQGRPLSEIVEILPPVVEARK